MKKILVDSNFLIAVSVTNDTNHSHAIAYLLTLSYPLIFPETALCEFFHLVNHRVSQHYAIQAIEQIMQNEGISIQCLSTSDYKRIVDINRQYQDARFDFVDMALMALAERLNIDTILTFDRRDFAIFRPTHVAYLKLLP